MGYKVQRKTYELTFVDYPGLEVRATSVSVGDLLEITGLADSMQAAPDPAQVRKLFEWFASCVTSWNLEDEAGKPLPPGADTLLGLDFDFALKLVMSWIQAVSSVRLPPLAQAPPAAANGTAGPPRDLMAES